MKILTIGASGSGTTTLSKILSKKLNYTHLDADNYYWKKTDPPFTHKIASLERKETLKNDFEYYENVIISGSLVSWGTYWLTAFDLVVFVYLHPLKRVQRLQSR